MTKASSCLVLAAFLALASSADAKAGETGQLFSDPTCECCSRWAGYMSTKGYKLDHRGMAPAQREEMRMHFGIKKEWRACHTAVIGGYVIEGHVPAEDVTRLLAEKPDAVGLTVPNMPIGSPGMEEGDIKQPYEVLLMKRDGTSDVWAKH